MFVKAAAINLKQVDPGSFKASPRPDRNTISLGSAYHFVASQVSGSSEPFLEDVEALQEEGQTLANAKKVMHDITWYGSPLS